MVWARLDDAILDNPKIAAAGPIGFALHVAAITWCCRNLTDGHIPLARVTALLDLSAMHIDPANPCAVPGGASSLRGEQGVDPHTIAGHLVDCGLWSRTGDGYQLHDFLHYNPSKSDVEARRASIKKRVTKHRSNGVTNAAVTGPPDPVPDPDLGEGSAEGNGACAPPAPPPEPPRADPKAKPKKLACRLPDDWAPSEALLATLAASETIRLGRADALRQVDAFRDHWRAESGAKAAKLDWDAAFRTWCRFQRRFQPHLPLAPRGSASPSAKPEPTAAQLADRESIRLHGCTVAEKAQMDAEMAAWEAKAYGRKAAP